jgi:glycosyltransferase involved in cell wall biosynthesis
VRNGPERGDVHAFYGVEPSFRVVGVRGGRLRFLGRFLYSWQLLRRFEREPEVDLVYARDYHTLALLALRRSGGPPFVLEVHQPPAGFVERVLITTLLRSPRLRRLVPISVALAEEYRRVFGAALRVPVRVAHDGADRPPPAPAARARREGEGGLDLGYVGHLYPGKGMELIEELARRLPQCRFHVIGGQEADVRAWSRRVHRDNVLFHGHLPHAAAQERMRTMDVLLAPYQRSVLIGGDGTDITRWMSPLKVFEYMGSARPMIASDLPVLREVLRDGWNALLADPDDAGSWVRRIRELEADPALARALAERAREDLLRDYTWERRAELVLAGLPVGAGA